MLDTGFWMRDGGKDRRKTRAEAEDKRGWVIPVEVVAS
jgi:hypothetical protein